MIVFSSGMNNNGCQNKHYPFEKTSSVVNQFLGIFSCSLVQRISKLVSQLMIRPHKLHKCLMKRFQGYRVKRHVWFSKFFKHDQPSIDHRSYTHNLSSCEIKERKAWVALERIFFLVCPKDPNIGTDQFFGATSKYPATIVPYSTCAHILKNQTCTGIN